MFKCEICYKDGKDNILKKILEKEFFFFSKQTWRYGRHFLWYYINKKDIFKLWLFYRENEVFLSFVHVLANAKGQSFLTKPQTCMKWKKIGIELKTVDILEKYLVTGCPIET